jgi:hypothetical protein
MICNNNYLGVVRHHPRVVTFGRSVFKGVHLECENKPIPIIHFIGYLSAKYLPPFFQLIPSRIKLNACSFTDENSCRFF